MMYTMKTVISEVEFQKAATLRTRFDDGSYPAGFWDWLAVNMHIAREFVRLALKTKRAGVARWSSDAICHVLRWQTAIRERGQEALKLNNNATAGLSRLTMETVPELRGFFSTRTPPGKEHARKLDGSKYSEPQDSPELTQTVVK